MPRALALSGLLVTLAAAAIGGGGDHASTARSVAAAPFAASLTAGVDVDYTPLASPRDAVTKADLIVSGTVADVVDGLRLTYPDPVYTERRAGGYATLVLAVDEVLSGDAATVTGGKVYVTVPKSRATGIAGLATANPHPRVVATLADITTWKPSPEVEVARPVSVPAAARLFSAYNDGLWLQGSTDPEMTGLYAAPDELAAAWGHPTTVAQVVEALRKAA